MAVMCNKGRKITDLDAVIGNNLRAIRLQNNLTQKALGKELGLTFQQIQKYEKGHSRMSASTLHQVSVLLAEPLDSFFYRGGKNAGVEKQTPLFNKEFVELFGLYCEIQDPKMQKELVTLLKTLANCGKI